MNKHWFKWISGMSLALLFFTSCGLPADAPGTPPAATISPSPVSRNAWDDLVSRAKQEGTVSVYAGVLGGAKQALFTFRDKYGINVDIVEGRPAETLAKINAERRAGLYLGDVLFAGNSMFIADISPLGITVPLAPLLVLPEVTDPSKWRTGRVPYLGSEGHAIVMVAMAVPVSFYNTDMVKKGEITSFLDYLTPTWKGKIVLSDPAVTGNSNNFFTLMVTDIFGKEKTLEILRQLAAQEPIMTRDDRLLLEWVARGKYPVGIGPSAAVYSEFEKLGAPIAYAKLKEPPFVSSGAGVLVAFDKAPHPNAAKLLVNWLLSKEGATSWANAHGYPSQRVDVPTDGFDPMLVPPPDAPTPGEEYLRIQSEMREVAGQIFSNLRR